MTQPARNASLGVAIVAKDADSDVARLLAGLRAGTSQPDEVVVVIDPTSRSARDSVAQLEAASCEDTTARIYIGADGGLAACWNDALRLSNSSFLVRLDAHGEIPIDFVASWKQELRRSWRRDEIVSGPVELVPSAAAPIRAVAAGICAIERSALFSGGTGAHKRVDLDRPVIASYASRAAYRPAAVLRQGGFRSLPYACEDSELAARMAAMGVRYRILPHLTTKHRSRGTIRGFARQKYRNGAAIGDLSRKGYATGRRKKAIPFSLLIILPRLALGVRLRTMVIVGLMYGSIAAWVTSRELQTLEFSESLGRGTMRAHQKFASLVAGSAAAFMGHSAFALGYWKGFAGAKQELSRFVDES